MGKFQKDSSREFEAIDVLSRLSHKKVLTGSRSNGDCCIGCDMPKERCEGGARGAPNGDGAEVQSDGLLPSLKRFSLFYGQISNGTYIRNL